MRYTLEQKECEFFNMSDILPGHWKQRTNEHDGKEIEGDQQRLTQDSDPACFWPGRCQFVSKTDWELFSLKKSIKFILCPIRHLVENKIAQALDQTRQADGKKDGDAKMLGYRIARAEVFAGVVARDRRRVFPTIFQKIFPIG